MKYLRIYFLHYISVTILLREKTILFSKSNELRINIEFVQFTCIIVFVGASRLNFLHKRQTQRLSSLVQLLSAISCSHGHSHKHFHSVMSKKPPENVRSATINTESGRSDRAVLLNKRDKNFKPFQFLPSMHPSIYFLFFLYFMLCFDPTHGQSCEPYALNFLAGSFCLGRFAYPVFRPANQTQNQAYQPILEQLFSARDLTSSGLSTGFAAVSPQCAAAVLALLCGVFVPGEIPRYILSHTNRWYYFSIKAARTSNFPFQALFAYLFVQA